MRSAPIRFEHVFGSSDISRYRAVELTRKRDSMLTALQTSSSMALEQVQSYESALSKTVRMLHDRSHRTSLQHQPCFAWNEYESPCWYFEWSGVLETAYQLQLEQGRKSAAEQDFVGAKAHLDAALATLKRRRKVVDKWLWKHPDAPLWTTQAYVKAQTKFAKALRAMTILRHCENVEEATSEQLYNAAMNIETLAHTAGSLVPDEATLELLEQGRVLRAWWKAHCLWDAGEHGAAIGLATAWKGVSVAKTSWYASPEWDAKLHDWRHDNDNIYYEKITTPTSI